MTVSQTLVRHRQTHNRQTTDKPEPVNCRRHREISGEFKSGLSLGQISSRERALISFLNGTQMYSGACGRDHL